MTEKLTGWSRSDAIGKCCREIFKSSSCGEECVLAESIAGKAPVLNRSVFITHRNDKRIGTTISAAPLIDGQGRITGGVQLFRDVNSLTDRALILDNFPCHAGKTPQGPAGKSLRTSGFK